MKNNLPLEMIEVLSYVEPFYDSPIRFYHNRSHIARMMESAFDLFDDHKIDETELRTLIYAIAFHDVIQHPVKSFPSNESLSAFVYQDYCKNNDIEMEWDVVELITSTEHHFNDKFLAHKKLQAIMLDFDLLSFADNYEDFCQTNHDIDNEYRPFFDEESLKENRKKFLKNIFDNKLLKYRIMDTDGSMTQKAYNNLEQYIMENYND